MPKEDSTTTGTDIYTGFADVSSATATPVRQTWLIPSPMSDSLLSTRNTPRSAHEAATKLPAASPRCTNP